MDDDNLEDVDMPNVSSSPFILRTGDTTIGRTPISSQIAGSQPLPSTQELQDLIASVVHDSVRDYFQQHGTPPVITEPNPETTSATPVVTTPQRGRSSFIHPDGMHFF
jgi:hypothetical protein